MGGGVAMGKTCIKKLDEVFRSGVHALVIGQGYWGGHGS